MARGGNIGAMLLSGQGDALKAAGEDAVDPNAGWDLALIMQTIVTGWTYFRFRQMELLPSAARIFKILLAIAVGVDALSGIAVVDRTQLMPLLISLGTVYFFFSGLNEDGRPLRQLLRLGGGLCSIVGVFSLMSMMRGAGRVRLLVISLLGYTVASYNRLAALVDGTMHYKFEHSGVYLIPFLENSGTINKIFPFNVIFGWPPLFRDLWRSEFVSVAMAGLNPTYIWSGSFGYIYSDLGWWAPVYLLFLGAFAGLAWSSFRRGETFGIVCYPWVAFSILFWIGVNFLFYDRFLHYLEAAILLSIYDRYMLRSPAVLQKRPRLRHDVSILPGLKHPA